MKLGLLSDIHEATDLLRAAIAQLHERQVDRLIVLGDVADSGERLEETVSILQEARATGVWGNHELGLCFLPSERVRCRHSSRVLDYFARLQGQLTIENCFFSHFQTWMNPTDLEQPWYWHGPPRTPDLLAQNFAAVPHTFLFQGHYHCWLAAAPDGVFDWQGEEALTLAPNRRFLFIIHAVCNGWCAQFDTERRRLEPICLGA